MELFSSSQPWRDAVIPPTPCPAFLAGRSRSCEVTLVTSVFAHPSVKVRFNSSITRPSPSTLTRSKAIGPRAPVFYFLGRQIRSSLARSRAWHDTAQLSEKPSRTAVNGLGTAAPCALASIGWCKRMVARPAWGPLAMT